VTRASWAAFLALLIFTMGTSIITPLLPLYQERYDLTNGEATLLFATYTGAVVPTMLIMGNVSDSIGRKRVLMPAIAILTAASLVLGLAGGVPELFIGRALQGIAIGSFLGVGAAFVVDGARPDGKAVAAGFAGVGFRVGFGLGPGIAGVVAEYAADPLRTPWLGHAALMLVAAGAVLVAPESISSRVRWRARISVGVPKGQLAGFATFLAPAAFLLSFMDGTVLSVVPLYMVAELDVDNIALVGLAGFLVLAAGGVAPLFAAWVDPRRAVMVGVVLGAASTVLIVAASAAGTVALVLLAATLIGLTNGVILVGATVICGISVPVEERGKLMSALYMCAYSGTLPTVALGYLSQGIGLTSALAVFTVCAFALAAFVVLVGGRIYRTVTPYIDVTPTVPNA
jgi:MFS family permease